MNTKKISNDNTARGTVSNSDNDDFSKHHYLSWRQLYLSKAKLKASSRTSGLMSGFAMVAMVEINLDGNQQPLPSFLCIIFSVMTTILISVHVFALMISVCILPNLETVDQLNKTDKHFFKIPPCDSPHTALRSYVEVAWLFSTGFGTLLFLIEIPLLMWVKFYNLSKPAAYASMGIMGPVCIIFLTFAVHFYRKLIKHKRDQSIREMEELQLIATQIEACY